MASKDYLKKVYRHFSDFVATASGRELEYFVLDSKFTNSFNYRINKMVREIRESGKDDIGFSIIFNTEGEIAIIDSNIIGRFIGNNFNIHIGEYYKSTALNKIIRDVINGSEKSQKDFIVVSYNVLYNTILQMYKEIKCRKEVVEKYKRHYMLEEYNGDDIGAVIICVLILEDICKYIGIDEVMLLNYVYTMVNTTNM